MPSASLVSRYRAQLLKLLPPGAALSRDITKQLAKSLRGWSIELARVHERRDTLYLESFPGTATELLSEWENLVGLPNECIHPTDIDLRRGAVIARLAHSNGQSRDDFMEIAQLSGYTVAISTSEVFLTGINPIGIDPIHSDPWWFTMRVSYESQTIETDESLECSINTHAHIHTLPTFNRWDAAPVSALTNLRSHFVPGEFVTHDVSGVSVIDSWTNRSTSDDWVQGVIPDGSTAFVNLVDGWDACDVYENTVPKSLLGLYMRIVPTADTLLKHGDFQCFIVYKTNSLSGGMDSIISTSGSELDVYLGQISTWSAVVFDYDGQISNAASGVDRINVLTICDNGSFTYLRVNHGPVVAGIAGGGYVDQALSLGGGLQGSILEIVASDFTGIPGSDATVDAVTSYLTTKYGVSPL